MSDPSNNDSRPSAADSFNRDTRGAINDAARAARDTAAAGVEAVQAKVDEVSERAGQAYTRGNVAVTRAVDPIPSLMLVGAVGFLAGYVCSELRSR